MSSDNIPSYGDGKTGRETGRESGIGRPALTYRRKINVKFSPIASKANQAGRAPLRCTVRWHGQELQFQTGEVIPLTKPGKGGKVDKLWDTEAWVSSKYDLSTAINGRLARWETRITAAFNELWDAAPFEPVPRAALVRRLFPEQTPSGHKLAETNTLRELLAE